MSEERVRTVSERMLDALDAVRAVLEAYRDSLPEKRRENALPHIKEALRALAGEKHSSNKAAYQAASFVRKAYAACLKRTVAEATSGNREAAGMVMREMADEALALSALGYGIDHYNPAFLQAKIKLPPLVKFENLTPAPDHDPEEVREQLSSIKEEAQRRGII